MTKAIALVFLLSLFAKGEFFKTRVGDLKHAAGDEAALGGTFQAGRWKGGFRSQVPIPRFENFAFVVPDLARPVNQRVNRSVDEIWLIVEMDQPAALKGFLDVWEDQNQKWIAVACELDPSKLAKCTGEEVRNAREWHASHQMRAGGRGGLWYRSFLQKDEQFRGANGFDETFTTLSGGRALAENLALDRELILGNDAKGEDVEVSSIKGVTVKAIPWAEWMPEGEIAVDVLSKRVPEDQYLLVVPSLQNLFGLMDRVEEAGTPILQSFAVGDQYRELPSRYRKQMGLDLPDVLARLLPVKSVAVTGGDPFFPTGSDVAVIFETDKVDFVFSSLKTTISAKAGLAGASEVEGVRGLGFENPTRTFSCHLAKLDGAVVVSNSARQVDRLREVAAGKLPGLGETDEYRFFRHRYPVGDDESAYVFISDACLRRWSGPKVRIAASRRSRALAALAGLTSESIKGQDLSPRFEPLLGRVEQSEGRILSENYGSLGFMTPISELKIARVSRMEKEAYERWRRGYENGWARFFDPIAIRLKLAKGREEMDMTILPLRVDSDYQDFISLAGKSVLSKASQLAPAESLLHFAMAVDHESEMFKQANVGLIDFLPSLKVNPLGWMGDSFSFTMGNTLAWRGELEEEMLKDLPVMVRVDVESRLKLALFLTAVKGSLEVSSPDLVRWETRAYEGRKYVAVIGDPEEIGLDVSIYYAALPTALIVTLNEDMLKRALEREKGVVRGAKGEGQMSVEASPDFISALSEMADGQGRDARRRGLSWATLPLLNEWHQSQSAPNPVAFHEARFATYVTCPGGLGYQWNAEDLTMESIAYGHPGRPRSDGEALEIFKNFKAMAMRASFEEGGMRMAVSLDKKSNFSPPEVKGAPRPKDAGVVPLRELLPLKAGREMIYETVSANSFDDGVGKSRSMTLIDSVVEKDGIMTIDEIRRDLDGGKEESRMTYEVGPKGSRLAAMTGKGVLTPDLDGFESPAELWAGMAFAVRKEEVWTRDGMRIPSLTGETVRVIGWENIKNLDGGEWEALKVERQSEFLHGDQFHRTRSTEWFVRGYGLVRRVTVSDWDTDTTTLVSVKEVGDGKK